VLSPEFVFEAPPGAALPDNKTYGVFWMPYKELATAFQLYGAFNNPSRSRWRPEPPSAK
jgi:putative ABC transport system permease protein